MEKKELNEWANKVSLNKKGLDKTMFNELVLATISRFEKEGYKETWDWLNDNYIKGEGNLMNGVILLRNNSKQIRDKLWSLNKNKNK